ncbi:hypothetical protein G6F24_017370 [Rhizopus arrhizus]|nr:hypothetical protein G6F24_017370 [Rhizopus arrhizus]
MDVSPYRNAVAKSWPIFSMKALASSKRNAPGSLAMRTALTSGSLRAVSMPQASSTCAVVDLDTGVPPAVAGGQVALDPGDVLDDFVGLRQQFGHIGGGAIGGEPLGDVDDAERFVTDGGHRYLLGG